MTVIALNITVAEALPLTLVVADPVEIDTATGLTAPEADPIFQAWLADEPLSDFLTVTARLGEFDTAQKKVDARNNLELQIIDLGTF